MQTAYKFSLEEAKEILRKKMNLPKDANVEIVGIQAYPYYGGCGGTTTMPLNGGTFTYSGEGNSIYC